MSHVSISIGEFEFRVAMMSPVGEGRLFPARGRTCSVSVVSGGTPYHLGWISSDGEFSRDTNVSSKVPADLIVASSEFGELSEMLMREMVVADVAES